MHRKQFRVSCWIDCSNGEKMKIIQIMPEFGLGGAEIMCENLVYGLKKLGHSVIVVSLFRYHSPITDRMEKAGIDIRYLDKKPGLDLAMIPKLARLFRKEQPDAVHTHRHVLQYAMPAAVLARVKRRVHTLHSIATKENGRLGRKFSYICFHFAGVIPVALSQMVRETVVEEYHLPENRIPVIFNGIDLSRCRKKEDWKTGDVFRILHIGRFAEAKNHECLVEAFCRFHRKYPDSELLLIGDGDLRPRIENLIKEKNLQDAVVLLGLQSDVYGYLHDADLFALPSRYEGIPMTLIEAMGTGLPIVASAVGGIPDMLGPDSAILTVPEADAVCEAFARYYLDASLRRNHGRNALRDSARFSVENMAEKYIAQYKL